MTAPGVGRAAVIFGALVACPFLFSTQWVVNAAIFTVMYAALATAWNLLGGYSGYLSLGHAAFFGIGAYAIGVTFTHVGIGAGYTPFFVLPLVGVAVAVVSVPIAWVALRVRAATFAIVTITLLFVVQQLAFNLHSITNGSQGIALPAPRFPTGTYERPFYFAMLAVLALAVFTCWWVRGSKLGLMLFAIRDDEDRAGARHPDDRGEGRGVRRQRRSDRDGRGCLGLLHRVHLSAVRRRSPHHDRRRADGVPRGPRHAVGADARCVHPRPRAAVPAYELGASQLYLVSYSAVFLLIILLLPRGILPSIADRRAGRRARRPAGLAEPVHSGPEVAL